MSDTIDLELCSTWLNAASTLGFAPPAEGWNWPEMQGGFVTNPVSLNPRTPAEARAVLPYPGGCLLHTGLPNPGLKAVLRKFAERWARGSLPVWVHLLAFLLFKFDSLCISEYRQQIKTFRLKYVFLAGKIIRSARYVVMKLPAKYPYKDVYEKCLS